MKPLAVVELVEELKTLRKGRGVLAPRIGDQVGPRLREAAHVTPADSATVVREKVTALLTTLAGSLAQDLRDAVLAAFAIHPDAKHQFLQDRVKWAAQHLDRDVRTARRRIDEAIEAIAHQAAVPRRTPEQPAPELAWHTDRLYTSLALDLPTPEVFELRRIIAHRDGLREIDLSLTLTAVAPRTEPLSFEEIQIDVFRGGLLQWRSNESADRFAFSLALAKPLARGARHEMALRYRVPPGGRMRPHYVCVPKNRCDTFELSVRFGQTNHGRQVWKLSGLLQRDIEDPLAMGEPVTVDDAGEVCVEFGHLNPGKAYGLRWTENPQQ